MMRKIKVVSQDEQILGWGLNWVLPACKSEVLPLKQPCFKEVPVAEYKQGLKKR
jgi:hypothetical protein